MPPITHFLVPLALAATLGLCSRGGAQTFAIDFSRAGGPPLVKGRFGVYQTPLTTLPRLLRSLPLLREAGVRDLRYEIGWGKPESLAFDQVSGSAERLRYDFSAIDAISRGLQGVGVRPLFAMSYCPEPLQSSAGWPAWKDEPSSLGAWGQVNRAYAAHLKYLQGARAGGAMYEVWNEPDMPEPGGKMFFAGAAAAYARLYREAQAGIKAADAEAQVGGAAIAYDLSYFRALGEAPVDFATIHAYDNFEGQIQNMRAALGSRPRAPIFLTEYASFTDMPADGPQSRHQGAMRFFRDARKMLGMADLSRVYWAQWLDAGDAPGMGLVTWDGHRKALFNAFKLFAAMPVDRALVTPGGATPNGDTPDGATPNGEGGLSVMASADSHRAAVAVWNEADSERSVTLDLRALPFRGGTMQLFRIDKEHASYVDNPASEALSAVQETPLAKLGQPGAPSWTGTVPAQSVAFLLLRDEHGAPLGAEGQGQEVGEEVGRVARLEHFFADRSADCYADFDPRSATARLGMGTRDAGTAQIAAVIDGPAPRFEVQVLAGGLQRQDRDSLLALSVEFPGANGVCLRRVLLHGALHNAQRGPIPGTEGIAQSTSRLVPGMEAGRRFVVGLRDLAPAGWSGQRVTLRFVMQDAGRGAWARLVLRPRR